jgi:hypothetical protein
VLGQDARLAGSGGSPPVTESGRNLSVLPLKL